MNNWNFKIGDEHAHRLALARRHPISIRELQAIVNRSAVMPKRYPMDMPASIPSVGDERRPGNNRRSG